MVPALLEIDPVELEERDRGVRPGRLPDLDLAGRTDRTGVLRDDLRREVVQPPHLPRVRIHLQNDAELPAILRREHLLADQIGEPVVRGFVLRHDGQVGIDAHEPDPVRRDFGTELPLVERQLPVPAVEHDFAGPGDGILDARFRKVGGQPAPEALVDQIEVQHPAQHRRGGVGQAPDAAQVLAHAPVRRRRIVEQLEVGDQAQFVQRAAERLAVVAVRLRAEQVADLGRRPGPAPRLLPQILQQVAHVPVQRGGDTRQHLPPDGLAGVAGPELLERRAAERVLGARPQVRRQEDAQRRPQRSVRPRVAQLDQLRRRHVEVVAGGRRALREHVDAGGGDLAAQRSGERDHQIRPQVRHPHAVSRFPVAQRGHERGQQQLFDAAREVGSGKRPERAAHAEPPDAEIV